MKDLKPVEFNDNDPLQEYYQDGDNNLYCVARLIDAAKDLPVFDMPLCGLDLSAVLWKDSDIFTLAYHCKKVEDADLDYPIILDWRGGIADGRHRIIKALVKGHTTIKAKRLVWRLSPCRQGE